MKLKLSKEQIEHLGLSKEEDNDILTIQEEIRFPHPEIEGKDIVLMKGDRIRVIKEADKKWSGDVETKYTPPEGTFTKSSAEIADTVLKGHNGDKGSAIKSINFYINRAGKNLSDADVKRIKGAIAILQMKENKNIVMKEGVAETILQQLGGRKFTTMTGAKNISKGKNNEGNEYLGFYLPHADRGINYVKITLNDLDTYDIEYAKIRGTNYSVVSTSENIYAENLIEDFETNTKLYLSI